ncbi:FKBP-type peptidyl-prolyl cis-trans isomerase, partial [candidate division KSB1 bacterium]|nr:FKBP-type peptidyl-prolyl cis-trans isomerase [candidate division KSB1 bacterium]
HALDHEWNAANRRGCRRTFRRSAVERIEIYTEAGTQCLGFLIGTIRTNLKTIGEQMKTESGLEYIEVEAGSGTQAEAGKNVSVHYTGKFQDGRVFDSSVQRGEPITFKLGVGQVIKGWDEGIALMKVGGKAQLIIPPHIAYGERGAGGVIPPNATLVFDVELVDVK